MCDQKLFVLCNLDKTVVCRKLGFQRLFAAFGFVFFGGGDDAGSSGKKPWDSKNRQTFPTWSHKMTQCAFHSSMLKYERSTEQNDMYIIAKLDSCFRRFCQSHGSSPKEGCQWS